MEEISTEIPSSHMTLACVKFARTLAHYLSSDYSALSRDCPSPVSQSNRPMQSLCIQLWSLKGYFLYREFCLKCMKALKVGREVRS